MSGQLPGQPMKAFPPRWPRTAGITFGLLLFLSLRGEPRFVGMMSSPRGAYFAVRPDDHRPAEWVAQGDSVGGYTIQSYDPQSERLLLQQGAHTLSLQLPPARVQPMERDEILHGLALILHQPPTSSLLDFIHPGLRSAVATSDTDPKPFARILNPAATTEIRALPPELQKALDHGLSAVEHAIGVRPTHGLWIKDAKGFAMTFVVPVGTTWYLAPSQPDSIQPTLTKRQPLPPGN